MNTLRKLAALADRADQIGEDIKRESDLWEQELEERKRLGITNEDEAYTHFIEFMAKHGYTYNKQPRPNREGEA